MTPITVLIDADPYTEKPEYRIDTVQRYVPLTGPDGVNELQKMALHSEEKVSAASVNEQDYLRKISLKMLSLRDPGLKMPAQLRNKSPILALGTGNDLSIPEQPQPQQALLQQNLQGGSSAGRMQSSTGFPSTLASMNNWTGQVSPQNVLFTNAQSQPQTRQRLVAQEHLLQIQLQHHQKQMQHLQQQQLQNQQKQLQIQQQLKLLQQLQFQHPQQQQVLLKDKLQQLELVPSILKLQQHSLKQQTQLQAPQKSVLMQQQSVLQQQPSNQQLQQQQLLQQIIHFKNSQYQQAKMPSPSFLQSQSQRLQQQTLQQLLLSQLQQQQQKLSQLHTLLQQVQPQHQQPLFLQLNSAQQGIQQSLHTLSNFLQQQQISVKQQKQ